MGSTQNLNWATWGDALSIVWELSKFSG